MNVLKPGSLFYTALILTGLLFQSSTVNAQCSVSSTYVGMSAIVGMDYTFVSKVLSSNHVCTLTMQMNVFDCAPSGTSIPTTVLRAAALTIATNPSCGWNCNCGQVTIDGGDGLPVELMEFNVGDESDTG